MGNVWYKYFNWKFQNDATIGFKFDVQLSCRAWRAQSVRHRSFLNPLEGFWEKLKIKTCIIENVLKCMDNSFNWIILSVATMGFKFDVHAICKSRWALSVRQTKFLNP